MNSFNQQSHIPWWSSFFTGLIVDVQNQMYSVEQTQMEVEFIQRMLSLPEGALIADIPCGEGRHSVALAKLGYQMQGVDISTELIQAATQAASTAGVVANLQVGDMKQLPWTSELDGAFCFGNAFAYFDDQGNRRFLSEVARSLKPKGRFLLQTNLIAESILTKPLARSWYSFGDTLFLHAASYVPNSATLTSEYTLVQSNKKEHKTAHYRVYQLRDLLIMLSEVGFQTLEVLGGLKKEPFKLGDPSLYLLVEK